MKKSDNMPYVYLALALIVCGALAFEIHKVSYQNGFDRGTYVAQQFFNEDPVGYLDNGYDIGEYCMGVLEYDNYVVDTEELESYENNPQGLYEFFFLY